MAKATARIALLCAVVGLCASATAGYVHYRLLHDPTYTSFCDVSATISCTQVYASRYAMFGGVSVAIFGGIWFGLALLLAIAWNTASPPVRENVPGYLFALSTAALAVILYLAYASFFLLKAVCIVCLTTYAAVIGLFLVSGAATQVSMTTLPRRALRDVRAAVSSPLAVTLTVLFLAGAGSALAFFPREVSATSAAPSPTPVATQTEQSELARFMASAPRVPLIVPAEGAKVLIVKFNDFQCPACGQSYLSYKPILAKYEASNPGMVKLVLKDFPLNPNCNPNLVNMVHPAACDAAVAVRLAKMHNKGDAMEEWLYTHQPTMTPAAVRQAAREIGGVTDFDEMYNSTLELVKAETALGRQVGVRSTPTFFIDGVKVEGAWQPQFFDQAIAFELQRAGVTK